MEFIIPCLDSQLRYLIQPVFLYYLSTKLSIKDTVSGRMLRIIAFSQLIIFF